MAAKRRKTRKVHYVMGKWWDRKTGSVKEGLGRWVLNAAGQKDWFWPKGQRYKAPR